MSGFDFPTLQELVARIQNDVKTELPQSNPWLPESWIRANIIGYAGRFSENYLQLNNVRNSLFIGTSSDDLLDEWGKTYNLDRDPATAATGFVSATGVAGSVIDAGETLTSDEGLQYATQTEIVIADVSLAVTLNRSGSVVTATTVSAHPFASGMSVTMSGAPQADYNGSFVIVVIDDFNFTYQIETTPLTPSSATAEAPVGELVVKSVDFGANTNQESGATLTFDNLIAGVQTTAYIGVDGLEGGEDQESDDSYRNRILFKRRNPGADNSVNGITQRLLAIEGITRIWVIEGEGTYTVYFVRDNDANIIPTTPELQQARNLLIADDYRPAHLSSEDIFVLAPTPVVVPFSFSSITPDTATMQNAITATLDLFFKENSELSVNIRKIAYDSAIFNTVDPTTGEKLTDFILATPLGDIGVNPGELAVFGGATFTT